MILTAIPDADLAPVLARYAACLEPGSVAAAVFERIAASRFLPASDGDAWHRDAVALAAEFGMLPLMEAPQVAFSWDGRHVRALTEPAVLLHEVAHFQLASPGRRRLPDFGLGAGPETGAVEIANRACRRDGMAREVEEQMASLLGILWEVALNQRAIAAFMEQNWLEGAGRPSAAGFLVATLNRLGAAGLIDADGHPLLALNITPDSGATDFA